MPSKNHISRKKYIEILDDDRFCVNPFGHCGNLNTNNPENPKCDEFNQFIKTKDTKMTGGVITDYLKCMACLGIFHGDK